MDVPKPSTSKGLENDNKKVEKELMKRKIEIEKQQNVEEKLTNTDSTSENVKRSRVSYSYWTKNTEKQEVKKLQIKDLQIGK